MSEEEQKQPEQQGAEEKTQAEQATAQAQAAKEKTGAAVGQILASLGKLKQDNPKVFFGGLGGIALIVMYLMFSGNPEVISGPAKANLQVGQSYTLKTPNKAGNEVALVRMVSTPGQMEAYDDTEETDRQGCKNLPEGTRVVVKDFFKQPGMDFTKVEIQDGDCSGKTMWTLTVNVR